MAVRRKQFGLPTKKIITEYMTEYDVNLVPKIRFHSTYCWHPSEGSSPYMMWASYEVQDKIEAFINFLHKKGVKTGEMIPYKGYQMGKLEMIRGKMYKKYKKYKGL